MKSNAVMLSTPCPEKTHRRLACVTQEARERCFPYSSSHLPFCSCRAHPCVALPHSHVWSGAAGWWRFGLSGDEGASAAVFCWSDVRRGLRPCTAGPLSRTGLFCKCLVLVCVLFHSPKPAMQRPTRCAAGYQERTLPKQRKCGSNRCFVLPFKRPPHNLLVLRSFPHFATVERGRRPQPLKAVPPQLPQFSTWAFTGGCGPGHQHCEVFTPDLPWAPRLTMSRLEVGPSEPKTEWFRVPKVGGHGAINFA